MEHLIGYSPNPVHATRQKYFDTLHEAINSGGKTLYSYDEMYDVVESVWNRISNKHRNAWRYSRYLNKSTYISLLNSNVHARVCDFFNMKTGKQSRSRPEQASMPKGYFTKNVF
ncbi:MAG: hypothetical protein AB3N28_13240 [Kordiimonas sp.]